MYYLNKIVGWVLSPHGILFLGLLVSWMVRPWRKCLTIVTIVTFWFLSTGIGIRLLGLPLEGEELPNVDIVAEGQYDAIVLLGGGMTVHAECGRAEMCGSADRVWHAARLWKAYHKDGDAMKLTLSGSGVKKSTVPLLVDFGVGEENLLYFNDARNTEEEAKLISDAGIKKILLVTSAWHMPRAKMLFERAGFDVTPQPTDFEMHCMAERPIEFADFIPNSEAAARCAYALKEWVGRFGYWVIGR